MKIKIVVDVSSGINKEEAERLGYGLVQIPYILDGIEYDDTMLTDEEFYKKLKEAKEVHTSQPSVNVLQETFDKYLKDNDYILYFPITSGLSSSYNTAKVITESDEKYVGKVFVVDHRTISIVELAMLDDVEKLIKENKSPEEIKNLIERNNKNSSIYISLETLEYLSKGGRLNPLVAMVGNFLSIRPVLFSDGGKFDVVGKCRTFKQAEDMMLTMLEKDINEKFCDIDLSHYVMGIAYTATPEKAKEYYENVKSRYDIHRISVLSTSIKCHIGPGALAIALYKKL